MTSSGLAVIALVGPFSTYDSTINRAQEDSEIVTEQRKKVGVDNFFGIFFKGLFQVNGEGLFSASEPRVTQRRIASRDA